MNIIEKNIIIIILIIASPLIWRNIVEGFIDINLVWTLLRIQGLILGIFLFFSAIYIFLRKDYRNLLKKFKPHLIDIFVFIFFIVEGLFSAIIGFLRQNEIIYIIGDTYHCFTFAFLYFLSAIFIQSKNIKKIINFSVWLFFILAILDTTYALYRYFEVGFFRKTAGYFFILPFIYFFIKYVRYRSQDRTSNNKTLVYLIISMIVVFLTTSFALIFVMFLSIILVTLFLKFSKTHYLRFVFSLILLIFLISLFGSKESSIFYRAFPSVILSTPEAYSRTYRIEEISSIFKTMSNDYFSFLIGMGQGATRVLSRQTISRLSLQSEDLHTIHFTLACVFFRMGFLGMVIFILFLLASVLYLYNKCKRNDRCQQPNKFYLEVILLFFIACIILSIRGYGIINAPILAIFLGLARSQNLINDDFRRKIN